MSEEFTDKKAHDAMIKARTVLLVSQPFFGCLALHLRLVEMSEKSPIPCRTMAVDGRHLYYYPPFVHSLTEQEIIGVVAHEVMHCAYQHMTRRGHRNPVIYNYAGDYVINDCLLKAGLTLPKKRLHDSKYDGMSTEEVYERIKQDVEKQIKAQSKGQKGKKGDQKGKGSQGDDEDGEGSMIMPDTDLNIDPGDCGAVLDAAGPGQKSEQDRVEREWDTTVRMAVNVARRSNAGTTPGYLERLVKQLKEPRVSWRELTRQFIDNSMSKDYSWSRPNRRHIHSDLSLPGFVSDSLRHMVFVADTSGSIDNEMLRQFLGEIAGALNDGTADKLTVLYADTRVAHVDEFVQGDIVKVGSKNIGGGGTAFSDSFRWIMERAPDAQCIVYLTDMLTSDWGEDPGIPTMWAAYLPAASLAQITPPFGTVIPVDTGE